MSADNEVYVGPLTEAEIEECLDNGADPIVVERLVLALMPNVAEHVRRKGTDVG